MTSLACLGRRSCEETEIERRNCPLSFFFSVSRFPFLPASAGGLFSCRPACCGLSGGLGQVPGEDAAAKVKACAGPLPRSRKFALACEACPLGVAPRRPQVPWGRAGASGPGTGQAGASWAAFTALSPSKAAAARVAAAALKLP